MILGSKSNQEQGSQQMWLFSIKIQFIPAIAFSQNYLKKVLKNLGQEYVINLV
jgi:hypothetical protein